ncbi:phosphoribosylglycinamide formyltransferase [candidate division KSB1 bacterium]|nr:phosphoribosylglycinamide formyltransferase [candidate division KSB1 bacterium]
MKKRIAIFISGRGSNMEAIIENAESGRLKDCCEIVLVFSNKKDARGLEIARQHGIEIACIESRGKKREDFDRELVKLLQPYQLDYIVLAGFMRILSPVFVRTYPNRIINIHPADTAEFQGVEAYKWAFEKGMSETKITVHFVDEGVDTGPVIAQQKVDLTGANSLEEVEKRGLKVEHKFYSKVLEDVFKCK